jgi:cytosine/adenosine deaminase-related metal-dependent hydrolase
MLLKNIYSITSQRQVDILVEGNNVKSVNDASTQASTAAILQFNNAIAFPGLINSHDHLDFNLFPKLGNRIYNNYVEWGDDIHKRNKDTIDKVLKVPLELRVQWGIYKNLLNGITTVVNHGPELQTGNNLITVKQCKNVLHSVRLEKRWRYKLNSPFAAKEPFVIHIGEGTDEASGKEIDTLLKWNLANRELIGIHAIAMNEVQAKSFKALIWCPDSNYFLVGKTASIEKLKESTAILFGTDSTVSADWNLCNHLRLAREQKMVTDEELLNMLTANPAAIWNIPGGEIKENAPADIVIARNKNGLQRMDAFFALNPEDILLVMHQGKIKLFDEEIHQQLLAAKIDLSNFSKVYLNGNCKYVEGNLPALINNIKKYYPEVNLPVTA